MKKILLLMLLSIAAHSQTLKQTTDNNILNQGNKGITALKLRNVLHAFVDSIRARGFGTVKSIAGTTNQISVTNNSGNYQLFLPSSISVNTINSNSSSIDNISVNDLSVMSNLTLPVGIANISGDMNLFGNLKFENGNQGNGKLLQSDAFGNANWWTPNYGVLSSPNNWTAANTFNSSIGFKSENSLTGHYSNYTFSNDGNFADGSLVINANKFTGGAVVSTPVIRINNDKVGIGVSYDDQFEKLAVNGTTILKEVSVTNDVIPANPYTKFRSFIDGTGNTGKYISYFDRFNGSSVTSSPTFVINQTGVNIGSILDPTEKLTVSGNVLANSFIVNGGTANQFVKANGSLDNNSYATIAQNNLRVHKDSLTLGNQLAQLNTWGNGRYGRLNAPNVWSSDNIFAGVTIDGLGVNQVSVWGTGGNGFINFAPQSASPATPTSGFRLFANSTGLFSWRGSNGFVRTFDASSISANRTWTMKDASGTVPLENTSNTYTQNQIVNANLGINNNNPLARVDAVGMIRSTGVNVPSSGVGAEMYINGGIAYFGGYDRGAATAIDVNFGQTNQIVLKTSGNVGIGTSSPSSKINAVLGSNDFLLLDNSVGGIWGIKLRGAGNSDVAAFFGNGNTGEIRIGGVSATYFPTFYSGNSEAMRISTGGNIGIGTTSPASNTILDINSTTRAVRIPRMTTTEINAVASPSAGMIVYNTTLQKLCYHNGTGWRQVTDSAM